MTSPISSISADQYHALRHGRGMAALDGWSSVSVTGADRHAFLNNFCTNEVLQLSPDTSCEAFFTNAKGKIVGHGLVTSRDEELAIIGVREQAQPLIDHLDRYVIREDVMLRPMAGEREYLLVAGDDARDLAGQWSPQLAEWTFGTRPLPHAAVRLDDVTARAIAWDINAPHFACLLEVASEASTKLAGALATLGFVPCRPESLLARRVEAGMPLFGVDFTGQNLPQEVARDAEAISFTKGCYLGQETVARIDALGHVNRRLAGVRFAGDRIPAAGSPLRRDGAKVGEVTSATLSPWLGAPLGLAMVRREANAVGNRLDSDIGACEVVALPVTD